MNRKTHFKELRFIVVSHYIAEGEHPTQASIFEISTVFFNFILMFDLRRRESKIVVLSVSDYIVNHKNLKKVIKNFQIF